MGNMRTELERKLAILSLEKDRKLVPHFTMFGDDNYKSIDYSIKVINGEPLAKIYLLGGVSA